MVNLAAGGYAAPADVAEWVDDLPDNVVSLLRSASLRVAEATFRSVYTDTPTGADAAALRDATCAQAATWIASGIDPADLGVDQAPIKASSLLTGRVEYDTSAQAAARQAAVATLAPDAVAILTAAGLIYQATPGFDSFGGGLPRFGLSGPRRSMSIGRWNSLDPIGPGELGPVIDVTDAPYPFVVEP